MTLTKEASNSSENLIVNVIVPRTRLSGHGWEHHEYPELPQSSFLDMARGGFEDVKLSHRALRPSCPVTTATVLARTGVDGHLIMLPIQAIQRPCGLAQFGNGYGIVGG